MSAVVDVDLDVDVHVDVDVDVDVAVHVTVADALPDRRPAFPDPCPPET